MNFSNSRRVPSVIRPNVATGRVIQPPLGANARREAQNMASRWFTAIRATSPGKKG